MGNRIFLGNLEVQRKSHRNPMEARRNSPEAGYYELLLSWARPAPISSRRLCYSRRPPVPNPHHSSPRPTCYVLSLFPSDLPSSFSENKIRNLHVSTSSFAVLKYQTSRAGEVQTKPTQSRRRLNSTSASLRNPTLKLPKG